MSLEISRIKLSRAGFLEFARPPHKVSQKWWQRQAVGHYLHLAMMAVTQQHYTHYSVDGGRNTGGA
jgi:hypothetical protein